jgi:hypothetical protein
MIVAPTANKLNNKVGGSTSTNIYRFVHDDSARSVLTVQVLIHSTFHFILRSPYSVFVISIGNGINT